MKRHQELLAAAIERDGAGQRALLEGDLDTSRRAFLDASELYRQSWDAAPPGSYGRLVGMLKSAVLAGDAREAAAYARRALQESDPSSPTASYAQALAALIVRDDPGAQAWGEQMRGGSDAFDRTGDAITALARRDGERYATAVAAIVRDFEQRTEHLTGVPIADTALMLERLAAPRGLEAHLDSPLLPSG